MSIFFILSVLLLVVFYLNQKLVSKELLESYECGFLGGVKMFCFSSRFFLVGLLFLFFDLEISLLVPYFFNSQISTPGFFILVQALILLTLFEVKWGPLKWTD